VQATGWTYAQIGELDLWQVRGIAKQMKLDAEIAALVRRPGLSSQEIEAGIQFILETAMDNPRDAENVENG